jgi:hypothetical protein
LQRCVAARRPRRDADPRAKHARPRSQIHTRHD